MTTLDYGLRRLGVDWEGLMGLNDYEQKILSGIFPVFQIFPAFS